jgi:glycosyltransferase involved in cell wall biosynthesis
MNYLLRAIILPFDVFCSMAWLFVAMLSTIARRAKDRSGVAAVFITPTRGGIESIYRKFGSMDVFLWDNPGSFTKTFRFLMGKKNIWLNLEDGYTLVECKIVKRCPLAGLAHMLASIMWCVARQSENVIIHARDPYYCGIIGLMVSKLMGCRFCVSIHSDYDLMYRLRGRVGVPTLFGSRFIPEKIKSFVLKKAGLVMPIRDSLRIWAERGGARSEMIRVIPHGFDMSVFKKGSDCSLKQRLGIADGEKVVSFAGRLSKENYVDDMLDLARRLALARDDFKVVVVGDGEERSRIERECERDGLLGKHVIFTGFLKREEVIDLRRMSSINLCLMGGFSLIEACASGRPVIAYNVEWHHELVRSSETGFLIRENDVDELYKATVYLLDRKEEARRMGEAAQKLAFERHDINVTNQLKREHYAELISM